MSSHSVLAGLVPQLITVPGTQSQFESMKNKNHYGGRRIFRKTMKRIKNITGTKGRGTFLRNWSKQKPGYHERTMMMKNCGKKCFLGPNKSFPICKRKTCKMNKKGVYAAYVRAREYETKLGYPKYKRISSKARQILHNRFGIKNT
jgi:hypothetical protein